MEAAVRQLEFSFKKLTTDLRYIAHRLETDPDASSSKRSAPESNPVALCKRLSCVRAELIELRRESLALTADKESATLVTTQLLVANSRLLRDIQNSAGATGVEEEVEDEAAASLNEVLCLQQAHAAANAGSLSSCWGLSFENAGAMAGIVPRQPGNGAAARGAAAAPLPKGKKSGAGAGAAAGASGAATSSGGAENAAAEPKTTKKKKSKGKKRQSMVREIASPAKPTSIVTQRSFDTVPESVRGRCKLDDVNNTLAAIRSLILNGPPDGSENSGSSAQQKTLAALQLSHLTVMGVKVTGYTGKCILGTLRSLKYINITSNAGIQLSHHTR